MRTEMWRQVRSEVRRKKLMKSRQALRPAAPLRREAGQRLLETYAALAERGEHLLSTLLAGRTPHQWAHYPEDDAIDKVSGFQWFYHSHSPEDRPGTVEHGHIHLFARRALWSRRLQSDAEKSFVALCGNPTFKPNTRHLLAIGLDAKGIPISLFMVNSWVTGDLMLNASLTLDLLATIRVDTGQPDVDVVIESVVQLCMPQVIELLQTRDRTLGAYPGRCKWNAPELELLAEVPIDLDAILEGLVG